MVEQIFRAGSIVEAKIKTSETTSYQGVFKVVAKTNSEYVVQSKETGYIVAVPHSTIVKVIKY